MPLFFASKSGDSQVGRTVGFSDPHTQGTISMFSMDPTFGWRSEKSIITRMTVSHQCNFQFLHTVGNDVFIYVFGDRIGQVTVSGLSMAGDCDARDTDHGFEKVLKWYSNNRVAKRKTPVKLMIGKTPIEGFCVGLSGDAVDPSSRLIQFGLTLMVLPEKT